MMDEQMQGHKSFKAIAVATDIKPAASPCGMCRQLFVFSFLSTHFLAFVEDCLLMFCNSMREFTPPSFPIYMYDKDGNYKVATIQEVRLVFPLYFLFYD